MKTLLLLSPLLLAASLTMRAEPSNAVPLSAPALDISVKNESRAAIQRGTQWLIDQQNADGHWSNPLYPALTALPVWALAIGGTTNKAAIDRAVAYILSCTRTNGAIYCDPPKGEKGGGLANYNTAICMVALHYAGRPDLVPVIQNARRYVAGTQHLGSDTYNGGMGYDPSTGHTYADLSNSYMAYEAMRLTQNVEDQRKAGEPTVDLDWKAAAQFIQRVQNRKASNDQPWASDDKEQAGGFIYRPQASNAGSETNAQGQVIFRSYGSMTYAGLLSFIYAKVDKNDPRVQSAFDWSVRHWNLEENPGMGGQGLYYFYNVLSKAMALYGQDQFSADGKQVNWRAELAKKLVSLQKIDPKTGAGYWVNPTNRWWEADPVLATAYTLIALEIAEAQ